ncbi:PAS domain-containing protein [Streptomyces swartbergensis]|uniref:PAS fold-4 domain-containing protein n=1 Tax=Streptomyces swartbergensis TaxID=487165 RepID=A0A243S2Y3_9ACTN|nr:PAS domain-containing protein [Streptomyces swartbergensis]OUD01856.1 hypothetical protein CA983_17915 [Streptomyces swartbergensis]
MTPEIDYAELFEATPSPYLVLGPDLVIADVNAAYLQAVDRCRDELIGNHLFDALPANPADARGDGRGSFGASLHRVLVSGKPDIMAFVRHDTLKAGGLEDYGERWWSSVSTTVLGRDGSFKWIIQRIEDVIDFARYRPRSLFRAAAPRRGFQRANHAGQLSVH